MKRGRALSITRLVEDLENVNIQADELDNPGSPDLGRDPRVQALVRLGPDAVEPLIDVIASDRRLTRSIAYWRFFSPGGEMASVAAAAYSALDEILGPLDPEPPVGDPEVSPAQPHAASPPLETPEAIAERLRQRWRGMDEWRRNRGKRVYLKLRRKRLGEALALVCAGTNVRCTVAPELWELRITREFRGETVRQALRDLGREMVRIRSDSWLNDRGEVWHYGRNAAGGGSGTMGTP